MADEDNATPSEIKVADLNLLINKMLSELIADQHITATIEESGAPMVYNFTIKVNGNGIELSDPKQNAGAPSTNTSNKEPLIDVIESEKSITVIAEMPGVGKDAINLKCDTTRLSLAASGSGRSYVKSVGLPANVNPKSASALYNNGVLEVVLKKSTAYKGNEIKIELK